MCIEYQTVDAAKLTLTSCGEEEIGLIVFLDVCSVFSSLIRRPALCVFLFRSSPIRQAARAAPQLMIFHYSPPLLLIRKKSDGQCCHSGNGKPPSGRWSPQPQTGQRNGGEKVLCRKNEDDVNAISWEKKICSYKLIESRTFLRKKGANPSPTPHPAPPLQFFSQDGT